MFINGDNTGNQNCFQIAAERKCRTERKTQRNKPQKVDQRYVAICNDIEDSFQNFFGTKDIDRKENLDLIFNEAKAYKNKTNTAANLLQTVNSIDKNVSLKVLPDGNLLIEVFYLLYVL